MTEGVTISQVARAAGVSRSTVSRAFTRPGMISPATVERILRAADQLGYVPNHTARALSTGRHGNIALIIPDVSNPFFPPMIRAAQKAADARDFCVFLGDSNEDPTQEHRLIGRFLGQIEGMVVASSRLPDEAIIAFAGKRPLVLINREIDGLARVLIDSGTGVTEAVADLARLGHRRLAYIGGPENSWSNQKRRDAVVLAAAAHGLALTSLGPVVPSYAGGQAIAETVLASGVSAAIVFDDITAHGIMSELSARGIVIPRDLSLIGCDDVLGAITNPPLSSISSPTDAAGKLAVDLLCDQLDGKESDGTRHILTTHFVRRATTGPAVPAAGT